MNNLDLEKRIRSGVYFSTALMVLMFLATSCATAQTPVEQKAELLGTAGESKSAYHVVAGYQGKNSDGHEVRLEFDGALIAIEKTHRDKIGAPQELDLSRFKYDQKYLSNEARLDHLKKITDDPKVMFISHIVNYKKDHSSGKISKISFLHNVYQPSQTDPCTTHDESQSLYEKGWHALDCLEARLVAMLEDANTKGEPFTHIVVMSMGWNNDQVESIQRYNKIMNNLKEAAKNQKPKFKPLVIGFSWPSVWGNSTVPVWKQLLHIFSYGNKANDADEIGYTHANYIVNNMVPRLKNKSRVNGQAAKVVLIGHSMGVRLLTRALFSSDLLKDKVPPSDVDYVFGLQGAFSINRFVERSGLYWPANLFSKGEGYPYSDYESLKSKIIMTWSEKDKANPFSTFLNGSAHIGGVVGFERSRMPDKWKPFVHLRWARGQWKLLEHEKEDYENVHCTQFKSKKKVFMTDLSNIIDNHNDICDYQMGNFIWEAMDCFSEEGVRTLSEANDMSQFQRDESLNRWNENEKCGGSL